MGVNQTFPHALPPPTQLPSEEPDRLLSNTQLPLRTSFSFLTLLSKSTRRRQSAVEILRFRRHLQVGDENFVARVTGARFVLARRRRRRRRRRRTREDEGRGGTAPPAPPPHRQDAFNRDVVRIM